MVIDELVSTITEKFKEGRRRSEIKEELMGQGYYEEDIDDAISKIQHDAIKQLPGISGIYRLIDHFESKQNLATPRMTLVLMIVCIGVLLLLAGALYIAFDPLGNASVSRDVQRQSDLTILQNALTAYYQQNQHYPNSLSELVPTFLSTLPSDPQSGAGYSYKPLNSDANYELCASFESQQQQCVNAATVSSIPIVPTATPVLQYVPQSASGASSYYSPAPSQ